MGGGAASDLLSLFFDLVAHIVVANRVVCIRFGREGESRAMLLNGRPDGCATSPPATAQWCVIWGGRRENKREAGWTQAVEFEFFVRSWVWLITRLCVDITV